MTCPSVVSMVIGHHGLCGATVLIPVEEGRGKGSGSVSHVTMEINYAQKHKWRQRFVTNKLAKEVCESFFLEF